VSDKDSGPAPIRGWRELLRTEDYWAIWLGLILIVAALAVYLPRPPADLDAGLDAANAALAREEAAAPLRTVAWYETLDAKARLKGTSEPHGKTLTRLLAKPRGWRNNPLHALVGDEARAVVLREAAAPDNAARAAAAAAARAAALAAEQSARAAGFADEGLNEAARARIADWRDARTLAASAARKARARAYNGLPGLAVVCGVLALLFGLGLRFLGIPFWRFVRGVLFVFALAVLAYAASQQALMKEYGIGYAAWAILFGMLVSNTVGTPRWVAPAVQTEFFIKTGLVLLGAEILFGKIVTIGIPGIFVAWLVTPTVLIFGFIVGDRWLKVPSKTLNVTICAAASVCGVSAAIATATACRAKKEELTLAVGLSLIFTSLMMIGMPALIKAVGMGQVLGGAWMGGTIDATGAVAAAGAFLGEKALYTSATIKMIQNVMIGAVAFFVALYWTMRVERREGGSVGAMEIWYRLPKFVLGFIGVSVVFSIIYGLMGNDAGYTLIDHGVIRGGTKLLRGWMFCLAFVSIGLATNFRELAEHFKGGKPLTLYAGTQGFNLVLTLLIAWLSFYVVFPHITEKI